jgi:Saxitoxin biosynthesis operon protein SxtJ
VARPDRKELRTFGLSLAGVCLVWAAILWWRGRMAPIPWLLGAAPLLAIAALTVPAALHPVYVVWMPVSRGIARALTWLLLTIVFVVVFTPYGVIMRVLGKDPLDRKIDQGRSSYWIPRRDGPFDASRLERQY